MVSRGKHLVYLAQQAQTMAHKNANTVINTDVDKPPQVSNRNG